MHFPFVKFEFFLVLLRLDESQFTAVFIFNVTACFFVLVVLLWSIEVNNVLNVLELRDRGIPTLEYDEDAELSDVEEVNQ